MVEDVPPLDVAKGHVTNCFVPVTEEVDDVLNRIAKSQRWVEVLFAAHTVEGESVRCLIAPSIVRVPPSFALSTAVDGFVPLQGAPR